MTVLSPEPGRIALVRQRRYLVENVTPPPSPDEAMLVDLSCFDDDAQGEPLTVLWEHELDDRMRRDGINGLSASIRDLSGGELRRTVEIRRLLSLRFCTARQR